MSPSTIWLLIFGLIGGLSVGAAIIYPSSIITVVAACNIAAAVYMNRREIWTFWARL